MCGGGRLFPGELELFPASIASRTVVIKVGVTRPLQGNHKRLAAAMLDFIFN